MLTKTTAALFNALPYWVGQAWSSFGPMLVVTAGVFFVCWVLACPTDNATAS